MAWYQASDKPLPEPVTIQLTENYMFQRHSKTRGKIREITSGNRLGITLTEEQFISVDASYFLQSN